MGVSLTETIMFALGVTRTSLTHGGRHCLDPRGHEMPAHPFRCLSKIRPVTSDALREVCDE